MDGAVSTDLDILGLGIGDIGEYNLPRGLERVREEAACLEHHPAPGDRVRRRQLSLVATRRIHRNKETIESTGWVGGRGGG